MSVLVAVLKERITNNNQYTENTLNCQDRQGLALGSMQPDLVLFR